MSQTQLLLSEWGLGEPWARALVATTISGFILYNWKPSYFFNEAGLARPSWLLTGDRSDANASFVPWWSVPVVFGTLAGGI